MTALKVLIGCERSGIFRRAFAALGHEAWSCDLECADDGSNYHIRDDVRSHLHSGWDLLVVAHPPCTRLCNSGVRWLTKPPGGKTLEQMWRELDEGAALFSACWNAPVERIAVENPVMHRHARERITNYSPPAQTVQPWWFGDAYFKGTSWYLRGLPALVPTNRLTPPVAGSEDHRIWSRVHRMPPGPERARLRSESFPGMAAAAAAQWGGFATSQLDGAA